MEQNMVTETIKSNTLLFEKVVSKKSLLLKETFSRRFNTYEHVNYVNYRKKWLYT
jgi:hypothetical protein